MREVKAPSITSRWALDSPATDTRALPAVSASALRDPRVRHSLQKLVVISLRRQHLSHALVGLDPVVHVVTHGVGVVEIFVANFHPDTDWLPRALRNQMPVEPPSSLRTFRIVRPLLVNVGPRIGQHAMIELRMEPRHNQRARPA